MPLSTKLRVVLDSNVFVSAIVWGGIPEKVLDLWLTDKILLYLSPEILLEILDVLSRFQVPDVIIKKYKILLELHAQKIIPESKFKVCRDAKDNKYLDLCFDCRADYLVTGDKDLLILYPSYSGLQPEGSAKRIRGVYTGTNKNCFSIKEFEGTKIVKPKEFLRKILL